MKQLKTCEVCEIEFSKPPNEGYKQWNKRVVCSRVCHDKRRGIKARAKKHRVCIYCKRKLTTRRHFRLRPNGMPLSYCKECDLVKMRVRYRANGHKKAGAGTKKHPKARKAFYNAKRKGVIKAQPCEVCGKPAQAHHPDYRKPLDVRWLCTVHHGMEHWKPVSTPILEEARRQIEALGVSRRKPRAALATPRCNDTKENKLENKRKEK